MQTSHASRRPIPTATGPVPVAVLLAAAAVGLLALLPSLAEAVWEVPHLFLLGAVISFGVFTQRNSDADGRNKDSSLAWSARCHPDAPLVVIADHSAPSDDDDNDDYGLELEEGARETPLSLPVRRLKPAPAPVAQESETAGGHASDGFGEETTDSRAASPSSGFRAGTRAVPSPPPSALDDDDDRGVSQPARPLFRKASTDWDVDAADDDGSSDEMTPVSSERSSVRADFAACASGYSDSDSDGDGTPVDLKLAEKAEAGGEEEVDRKADEFIAKFRQQIRLQRH